MFFGAFCISALFLQYDYIQNVSKKIRHGLVDAEDCGDKGDEAEHTLHIWLQHAQELLDLGHLRRRRLLLAVFWVARRVVVVVVGSWKWRLERGHPRGRGRLLVMSDSWLLRGVK